MKDKIYRFIRKRAAFKHGGLVHQTAEVNDVLIYAPYIHSNEAPTLLKYYPLVYEHRTQRFWLWVYNKLYT